MRGGGEALRAHQAWIQGKPRAGLAPGGECPAQVEDSVLATEYSQQYDVDRLREQGAPGVREGAVAECSRPGTQHLLVMPKSNRFMICTDGNSIFKEIKPWGDSSQQLFGHSP